MLHIFPTGPLCSLRRALMLWLMPLYLLVGAFSAGCAYWGYSRMVTNFMDQQMQALAQSFSGNESPLALAPQTHNSIHREGSYMVQLFGAQGQLLGTTYPGAQLPRLDGPGFREVTLSSGDWRVYAGPSGPRADRQVQVAQSMTFRQHVVAGRALESVLPILLLLPLTAFILWGVISAVSRELGGVAREAAAQDEHSNAPLPLERVPHEIKPLVVAVNSMLSRLRGALATQRRFVQDAAHELRTPITAIGLQLENMRCDVSCPDGQGRFDQLEAGVQRAQRLVDQLLRLSRHEAAAAAEAPTVVDVHAMVRDSVGGLIALADQRGIDLGVEGDGSLAQAHLKCPPGDLRSVIDNLVENALRYTPAGGVVDVHVRAAPRRPGGMAGVVVEVVDTGPGIPEDMLPRVFDRFFRVPGTEVRGNGLGLAIAQAAAGRCGLRVVLANRADRSGLVACVELAG